MEGERKGKGWPEDAAELFSSARPHKRLLLLSHHSAYSPTPRQEWEKVPISWTLFDRLPLIYAESESHVIVELDVKSRHSKIS